MLLVIEIIVAACLLPDVVTLLQMPVLVAEVLVKHQSHPELTVIQIIEEVPVDQGQGVEQAEEMAVEEEEIMVEPVEDHGDQVGEMMEREEEELDNTVLVSYLLRLVS